MLLKPKSVCNSSNEEFENKLIIEKWMKRNSSSKVTIGKGVVTEKVNEKGGKLSNKKDVSSKDIQLRVSKTEILRIDQNIAKQLKTSHKMTTKSKNFKRPKTLSSDSIELNVIKTKLIRKSLPVENTDLKSVIETIPTKIAEKKSVSDFKTKTIIPKVSKNLSCSVERVKTSLSDTAAKQKVITPPVPVVQCNIVKTISLTTNDSKNAEINTNNKESVKRTANTNSKVALKNLLSKEMDSDVYTNLLDNYRYLVTPKSWSVTEFMNETKERYIVFYNTHVIKENDTLISVMKKSLIIDKSSTMSYSVHGLPVDIKGTILPRVLDSTKKLLSILHIFDKMQVCEGIGSDLKLNQTDFVFKDNCRYWRHKDCAIVLIKAIQCPICIETRNFLLEGKNTLDNELINPLDFVCVEVKKE